MNRVLITSICAGLAVVACGGGATQSSSSGGGSSSAGTSAAATSTSSSSGSSDTLTVSGSLSLSVQEAASSANMCQPAAGGGAGAILSYGTYNLQFSLPPGTTTFPGATALVALFSTADSSQEWSIGSRASASAAGTATLSSDGKHGTVDVDMLPDPPSPNPNLKPIHVKGSFSCS